MYVLQEYYLCVYVPAIQVTSNVSPDHMYLFGILTVFCRRTFMPPNPRKLTRTDARRRAGPKRQHSQNRGLQAQEGISQVRNSVINSSEMLVFTCFKNLKKAKESLVAENC